MHKHNSTPNFSAFKVQIILYLVYICSNFLYKCLLIQVYKFYLRIRFGLLMILWHVNGMPMHNWHFVKNYNVTQKVIPLILQPPNNTS
jgi:hypothetical protein